MQRVPKASTVVIRLEMCLGMIYTDVRTADDDDDDDDIDDHDDANDDYNNDDDSK